MAASGLPLVAEAGRQATFRIWSPRAIAIWRRLDRGGAVAGHAGPSHAAVGQRLRKRCRAIGLVVPLTDTTASCGFGFDPEGDALAVAGISHHHRPFPARGDELLQHAPSAGPGTPDDLERQPHFPV